MRLLHVVPHVDAEASGPAYSVTRLCAAQARAGHEVELMCLAAGAAPPGVRLTVHRQWPLGRRLAFAPALARDLAARAAGFDVVHDHSLWAMPNLAVGLCVPGSGALLVTSPRGTLAPVARARSRWLKRALWPLQRPVLARAGLLHATSAAERADLRAAGFHQAVATIPNGVDLPTLARAAPSQRRVLSLGRLHPIKGLDRLLEAWARLAPAHPGWSLVLAGPGEARHERALREQVARAAIPRVSFVGPAYGEAKSALYASADLFVLPSLSENFGMVVAEALAHGVPVLASQGTPWARLEAERCGWWVAQGVEPLAAALGAALALPEPVRREMGERGRVWMARDFGWDRIARDMLEAYAWARAGGVPPASVERGA
jgi:glycosyltransferase involved in cell wall biosynthesis